MPTLERRQDGCYFVRHFHRQHFATWQITAAGVEYLGRRGVHEGDQFSTGRFMHLWENGWVYIGDNVPLQRGPTVVGDADVSAALRDAIRLFHVAVHNNDIQTAMSVARRQLFGDGSTASDQLRVERSTRLAAWRLRDVRVVLVPEECRTDFMTGVEAIATVSLTLSIANARREDIDRVDFDELWTKTGDSWQVCWTGLPEPNSMLRPTW